jgi:hypothetical protein
MTFNKNIMKKIMVIALALMFTGVFSSFGQDNAVKKKNGKWDQSDLTNDIYVSYGTGTVFYFIENDGFTANSLSGTFLIGFARSINKVIAVGFQLSYTNIGRTETPYSYSYPYPTGYHNEMTDNLWQGIANIRFRYINSPSFCMYSGVGMGVTMDYWNKSFESGETTKGQELLPAGQLTLLGFRVGHAFSFFGEFGIGTNSIINAGFSYKFTD